MKSIVSVPSQYGSPVLKSLSPQLVSVQSARRFFLFAFRIPGQHHGPKLRDPSFRFLKRPALVFFELFFLSFVLSLSFGFSGLLKHQGQSISPPHTFIGGPI
ncbi:UNVERIFIED_CONTAM: hypothetical protein NCL1_44698 [Trichonephila clavipes]